MPLAQLREALPPQDPLGATAADSPLPMVLASSQPSQPPPPPPPEAAQPEPEPMMVDFGGADAAGGAAGAAGMAEALLDDTALANALAGDQGDEIIDESGDELEL